MPKRRLKELLNDSDFDPPAQSWLILSHLGGVLTAGAMVMGLCQLERPVTQPQSTPKPFIRTVMIAITHR